ncbi:hypothetical protein [uncultured Maribacter sp.]|uniref:hypothetical protein n=1 Tax=uncultured Maribacter sp. TaxID=431308 RepID=UPI00262E3CDF|nr:hypothetical protein [uncultured Maribacter sp.]
METNIILKALYEQRKLLITQNYKTIGDKTGFAPSYVYAVANDVFPIFHTGHYQDIEIYKDFYSVSENQIQNFIKYIDEIWLKNEKVGFYDLEDKYGGRGVRFELINMLRYCHLDNRFSGNEFWNYLMENGPVESHSITRDFDLMFDA